MGKLSKQRGTEICCMCGRSVAEGRPGFEDRERDYDTVEYRRENGCRFPHGDYICRACQALRAQWNRSDAY